MKRAPGRSPGASTVGITVAAAVVVAVLAAIIWWATRSAPPAEQNVNTTVPVATPEDIRRAERWPTYYSSELAIRIVLPTGLTPCRLSPAAFELRTDACGSATPATLTVRRDDSWSGLAPTAAFDQVFAQELREAGRESVSAMMSTTGATAAGGSILQATITDTTTGAVISKGTADDNRVVAVTIRRDRSFAVPSSELGFDDVVTVILQSIEFTAGLPADLTQSAAP